MPAIFLPAACPGMGHKDDSGVFLCARAVHGRVWRSHTQRYCRFIQPFDIGMQDRPGEAVAGD